MPATASWVGNRAAEVAVWLAHGITLQSRATAFRPTHTSYITTLVSRSTNTVSQVAVRPTLLRVTPLACAREVTGSMREDDTALNMDTASVSTA
jgi:hypothetical protein